MTDRVVPQDGREKLERDVLAPLLQLSISNWGMPSTPNSPVEKYNAAVTRIHRSLMDILADSDGSDGEWRDPLPGEDGPPEFVTDGVACPKCHGSGVERPPVPQDDPERSVNERIGSGSAPAGAPQAGAGVPLSAEKRCWCGATERHHRPGHPMHPFREATADELAELGEAERGPPICASCGCHCGCPPVPQDEEREARRIAYHALTAECLASPAGYARPRDSDFKAGWRAAREFFSTHPTAPTNAAIEAEAQNRLGGDHPNCESRVNSFIAGARWMRAAHRGGR